MDFSKIAPTKKLCATPPPNRWKKSKILQITFYQKKQGKEKDKMTHSARDPSPPPPPDDRKGTRDMPPKPPSPPKPQQGNGA